MTPRVIKYEATYVAIAMPLPNSMAKERFSINEWKKCYGEESIAGKILSEAKQYNGHITDVCINWSKAEFYFKMYFQSKSFAESFIQAITEFIV